MIRRYIHIINIFPSPLKRLLSCHCEARRAEAISENNSEIASLPLRYAQGFGSQ
jgi:hypothetical protein